MKENGLKVIAKVTSKNMDHYVFGRRPEFLYTKMDENTIIEQCEGMLRFYSREPYDARWRAFGGREFEIELTDGSVEKFHGQWWCGMNKTSMTLFDIDKVCSFAYGSEEDLRQCYVFIGCYADKDWVKKIDSEYKGKTYEYWEYEEIIRRKTK